MPIFGYLLRQIRSYGSSTVKSPSRLGKTVSLDHFLQRTKVLALWREILRTTRRISDASTRAEMRQLAKDEFERNRHVTDISQIRYLLSTGRTQWQSAERYIDGL